MTLETRLGTRDFVLNDIESRNVRHQLGALERRLAHRPDPSASLVLKRHAGPRQFEADLTVRLGPLGAHLVSHQAAETPEHAVRLAVADIERQLDRRLAGQRGEPTYGVPSRRRPKQLRPKPLTPKTPMEEEAEERGE